MSEPAPFHLRIDALAAGGDGVGRDDAGRVTFVPRTAPGDRVRAAVVEEHRAFARAEPLAVEEPSPDRAWPPCPLFRAATCGGCQWQHIGAEAQARAKEAIVRDALRRAIAEGMEIEPIAAPVSPYRWRRRARFHWYRPRGSSRAAIGFFAPRSHRVTDVEECPQIEEALERALAVLRADLSPNLGRRGEILAVAGHGGDVHVSIHGRADEGAAAALVGRGPIAGVRLGRQTFGEAAVELEPGIPGRADDFAQASREGNAALRRAVTAAAAPLAGTRVLELYAGTGNLTRPLGEAGAEVVAVDRGRPPALLPPAVRWVRASADRAVADLAARGDAAFGLVVLDPPRTGAKDAVSALAELGPPRALYVSCDPATLARDLDILRAAGYELPWAKPFDLMPQTAHVEVLAEARRPGAGPS